ncbi:TPA: hypothetical protein SL711_002929 [Pseudomonas aeruginosa]|nr:hypothetical protein [Pseudomonas aeruginosa]
MSSTQHQLIEQCATRLRGIVEALDNIHHTSPQRWLTDLDDVHSSAESLLALINDQAPTLDSQGLAGAALAQPSPAPELPERGTQHRFSTNEQNCRHDFAGVWWNDNGETKTGRECRHCGFFVADVAEAAAEQAEAERQEVVDFNPYRYHAEKIRQRADGAASAYEAGRSALGYMEDIAESALIVRNGLDELSAQHERITAKLHDALDESDGDRWKMRSERDAANARLHEVATACATAEQERDGLWRDLRDARAHIDTQAAVTAQLKGERDAALARVAELEHVLRVVVNAADHGSWPTTVMNGIEKVREVLAGSAPPVKAQPEETPGEILAAKLIETWVEKHGKPAPWSKIVEITALATNMPNDERDRLLALDDDVDAQAQHSVPEKVRTLLSRAQCEIEHLAECLENVCEDEEDFDVREDVADGRVVAADIAHMLAAAPGKEVPQAWLDVQAERKRQVEVDGYHGFRDSHYINYELSKAARAYIVVSWHALSGGLPCKQPESWPWMAGFKWSDGRTMLVKACALTLAEIERLDRAGISQNPQPGATTASS